jgi:cholesterol transport system auxiliary component
MKKNLRLGTLLCCLLLSACATNPSQPGTAVYDFGPLPTQPRISTLPPLSLAEITAPAWLDSPNMVYRLSYANRQQARPYTDSHWSMPPAELLTQRLKARIAAAGGIVASLSDSALTLPLLRIELDDFSHDFETPGASTVQVAARATLFSGRTLLAQTSLRRQLPAPSPDAAGSARALADASDLLITDLLQWLTTVAPKK